MNRLLFSLIALTISFSLNAQIITQATSPTDIVNQIPGFSQVSAINTFTIAYTPPIPPTQPTPVDGDSTTEGNGAYMYGSTISTSISIANGNITSTTSGKVWTLRINIPNSLNIGLLFSQFNLSTSAEMYIYNDAQSVLKYKIKKSDFTVSDTVSISSMTGSAITIYIIEVGNSGTFQSSININSVIAGYQNIDDVGTVPTGTSGVNNRGASINCIPEMMCYSQFMPSARAVARIEIPQSNGTAQCTCTLLNNEKNDGRAYLLTAFHCIDANSNGRLDANEIASLRNVSVQFQFWRTVCNGTINNTFIEFNGAQLRASARGSDVVLLELINAPGIGDAVNYAGWNRQTAGPSGPQSFIIHHPNGEDMRYTQASTVRTYIFNSDYWQAFYSAGVVAPGSSGSALFNQNTQVVGQLKAGWSSCNFTAFSDRYGKFSSSWFYAGLQPWLSPIQNLVATNNLILFPLTIQGPDAVTCGGGTGTYSVPNVLGATFNWSVSSNLTITSGQNTSSITIRNSGTGNSATITLLISTPNRGKTRSLTVTKTIGTGAPVLSITSSPGACNSGTQTWSLSASSLSPVTSWQWTVDNPASGQWFIYSPNSPNTFVDVKGGGGISITAVNACGSAKDGVTIFSNCPRFAVAPNPATSTVQISPDKNIKNTSSANFNRVNIYDQSGNIKLSRTYGNISSTSLDVSSLSNGTYIVEIISGINSEKHQLQIIR